MKLATSEILTLSKILSNAKLGDMNREDKFKIILAIRALRSEVIRWQEFVADAHKRLSQEEMEDVCSRELTAEKDVELPSLSRDGVDALIAANSEWVGAQAEIVDRTLYKAE